MDSSDDTGSTVDQEESNTPTQNFSASFQTWRQKHETDSLTNPPVRPPKQSRGRPTAAVSLTRESTNETPLKSFLEKRKRKLEMDGEDGSAKKMALDSGTTCPPESFAELMSKLVAMDNSNQENFNSLRNDIEKYNEDTRKDIKSLKDAALKRDETLSSIEARLSALENTAPAASTEQNEDLARRLAACEDKQSTFLTKLLASRKASDMLLRQARKDNMMLKGRTSFSGTDILREANDFFLKYFNLKDKIIAATLISTTPDKQITKVTVDTENTKKLVFKNKKQALQGLEIFVEDDLLPEDQKLRFLIREKARLEKSKGNKVEIRNRSIKVNNKWFYWNELDDIWSPAKRKPKDKPTAPKNE